MCTYLLFFFNKVVMHPTCFLILCMHLKNVGHTTILHKYSNLSTLNTNHYNYETFFFDKFVSYLTTLHACMLRSSYIKFITHVLCLPHPYLFEEFVTFFFSNLFMKLGWRTSLNIF